MIFIYFLIPLQQNCKHVEYSWMLANTPQQRISLTIKGIWQYICILAYRQEPLK